jgi:hypothetical protein
MDSPRGGLAKEEALSRHANGTAPGRHKASPQITHTHILSASFFQIRKFTTTAQKMGAYAHYKIEDGV